jgi:hypothetical protein
MNKIQNYWGEKEEAARIWHKVFLFPHEYSGETQGA